MGKVKFDKADAVPGYLDLEIFTPLVFTSGGYLGPSGSKLFREWKKHLSPTSYMIMMNDISMILLRARVVGMRWRR